MKDEAKTKQQLISEIANLRQRVADLETLQIDGKRIEEALQKSEGEYLNLVDHAPVGIYKTSLQGDILYANEALAKIMEFETAEEFISAGVIARYKNPEDRTAFIEKLKQTGRIESIEIEVITKTGASRHILLSAVVEEERIEGIINDITEHKRAEQALRESEEKFRNLAEKSPNAIFINQGGSIVYANEVCEQLIGYSREEILSPDFDFMSLIAPESIETVQESYRKHRQGQEIPPYEYQLLTKEGKRLDAIHTTRLITYEGQPATLGIVTDITERKQAEEALQESENRFRMLIENIGDVITLIDAEGTVKYVSPSVRRVLGYTEEELLGQTGFELVYPDDYEGVMNLFAEVVQRPGEAITTMFRIPHKDGSLRWVEATGTNFFTEPGVKGIVANYRDVTEHKEAEDALRQSEEQYRALYEEAPIAYYAVGIDGRIRNANPRTAEMSGYALDDLIGRPVFDLYPDTPAGKEKAEEMLRRVSAGEEIRGEELEWCTAAGKPVWISLTVRPSRDAVGRIVETRAMAVDITERKRAEDALQQSEAQYRGLFEHMLEGFAYCKMIFEDGEAQDFTYLAVNDMFEKLTGLKDVVGKRVTEVIPGIRETDAELFDSYTRVSLTGEPEKFEMLVEALKMWFSISVYSPKRGFFVAVFDVITERKQAEGALVEERNLLRTLIDNLPDYIYVLDTESRFIMGNIAVAHLMGASNPDELIGKTDFDFYPQKLAAQYHADDQAVIRSGKSQINQEEVIIGPSGSTAWVLTTRVPLQDSQGKIVGLVGISRDITERMQVAEQLRLQAMALEAAANGIVITDREGAILWVNPAFTTLAGYTAQEAIGQNPCIVKSGMHDQLFYQNLWETILSGQVWHGELINRRKDGNLYHVDQTITPVRDDHGEISRFVAIELDITERKQAEQALQESEELLRQVVTSISPHIYVTEVTEDGQRLNRYLSPNVERLTGYPYEKFVADWSFWPSVVTHPEDRAAVAEQVECLVKGQDSKVEYRIVRADDEVIWVHDSGRTEVQGTSRMIYGVVSDITESRWAQEEIFRLYTAERERYHEAEALRQAALALASTLDLNQVIERILIELQNVVPYDTASVQLLENEHHLKIIGGRGFSNTDEIIGALIPTSGHIPNVSVLERMEPIIVKDAQLEYAPFMTGSHESKHIRGWLGVPMSVGTQIIGMVTLDKEEPDFYTKAQAQTAMAYAAQAAIAIENARLHTETEQRAQQLAVMHDLDRAISASLHIDDVYQAFSKYTELLLSYDRMSIVLLEGDKLHITYVAGLAEPAVGTRFPLKDTTSDWVATHHKPLLIHNVTTDAYSASEADWATGAKSVMVLPLQVKGHAIGTWNISSQQVGFYDVDDLHIAELIADQLTIGIENARLYEQAQQEIAERKQAQGMLEIERASLAQRVAERTAELSTANAELARAARLKDEFLANMSHELRTPLNAILGMSEVLHNEVYGPLNEEQLGALSHVEEGGRHLLDLINDILDLSKIEADKLELSIGPVLVDDICQASLRFIKQMAQKKRIKVFSTFDNAVETIQADQRRLKQILVNLLSNAVKFTTEEGQVGLEVEGDATGQAVHFTVWDTGIGISEEEMKHLFKPFLQIDSSLSRQHEGTGLGLSLVSRLAEMHGGGVSVESEVGRGSHFTVSLPRQSKRKEAGGRGSRGVEENNELLLSTPAPKHPRTILLAEDNETNIIMMRDILQAKGHQVIVARNGLEAIEQAREKRPDVILMDIQMPELDGLEATKRIRADAELAAIPIIALTALAMPGDREWCMAAGANEYLSKPVSSQELMETIETQIEAVKQKK